MKIEPGQFLKFNPPKLAGIKNDNKQRYMLVIKVENGKIEMINVSSIKGKEAKLLYDSNIEIENYTPLYLPSFVKIDTTYKMNNIKEAEESIYFSGNKLEKNEFEKIMNERLVYLKKFGKENVIEFSDKEFLKYNNMKIKIE